MSTTNGAAYYSHASAEYLSFAGPAVTMRLLKMATTFRLSVGGHSIGHQFEGEIQVSNMSARILNKAHTMGNYSFNNPPIDRIEEEADC